MQFQPDLNIFKCHLTEENLDWANITILNQVNQNASKPFEKGLVNQSKTLLSCDSRGFSIAPVLRNCAPTECEISSNVF